MEAVNESVRSAVSSFPRSDFDIVNQEGFLQLGIAGAALLVLAFSIIAIVYLVKSNSKNVQEMADNHAKTVDETNKRWSGTIDIVAQRFDATQRETNLVLRDFATIMRGVEVKIDNAHKKDNNFGDRASS